MTAIGPVTVGVGTWPFSAQAGGEEATSPASTTNTETAATLNLRTLNGKSLRSFANHEGGGSRRTLPSLIQPFPKPNRGP